MSWDLSRMIRREELAAYKTGRIRSRSELQDAAAER
jgi:hypothetical protein